MTELESAQQVGHTVLSNLQIPVLEQDPDYDDLISLSERGLPARRKEIGNDAPDLFTAHHARLFGIAYRMLGSRADAEDLLQDVYLRWHQSATHDVQSPLAFLITITTRLCLDRLRSLKKERSLYFEPWLPEPIVEDDMDVASPDEHLELREKVSIGFFTVLECLGPEERAAFLLHDIFDYDYEEVARILQRKIPSCRQMVHRARLRLRAPCPRFIPTSESRERVLEKFLSAIKSGSRQAVMDLLAEDVEYIADGGGKVVAAIEVLRGRERLG